VNFQELELLDLRQRNTVSEIVDGLSRCSFGARMLGEAAATLTCWASAPRKPLLVYDGPPDSPLGCLLGRLVRRGWFARLVQPQDFESGEHVLVVGPFSERHAARIYEGSQRAIFINSSDLARPGQFRDGFFPDVVFSDPAYILPLLEKTLEERLESRKWTVSEWLESQREYGGLAAEVAGAAQTFRAMVEDRDCTVVFTVSGAMTIAKMGLLICDMIDLGWVQAVASTGALMAHGLVESVGLRHFKFDPAFDDAELAARRLNRVTDTLEPEENLDHIEGLLDEILGAYRDPAPLSPRLLNRMIGEHLARNYPHDRGILKSAYLKDVPVYVPAFVDSEIGNDVYVHNVKRRQNGRPPVLMDLELDTAHLIELAGNAAKIGIFSVGGGVPRNNIQNVAPLIEIMNERLDLGLKMSKFSYGCRICPDRMHYGHLSGCTYSEGMSWRKMDTRGRFSEVHADATQVWPFLVKYVMERS
jgi:deoxyhypusine synthase